MVKCQKCGVTHSRVAYENINWHKLCGGSAGSALLDRRWNRSGGGTLSGVVPNFNHKIQYSKDPGEK